jgi:Transposase DDE domain
MTSGHPLIVPDYTTLYRFLRWLDEAVLEQSLRAVVQRLLPRPRPLTTVAVDATRLTPGAVSTFCVKRVKDREPGLTWHHWLQWTMAVDLDHHVSLARTARRGPTNDGAILRPLVSAAHDRVPIGLVLADAEFNSERNHQHIRHVVQAYSVIPAKRGATQWKIQGTRAQKPQAFPAHLSRRRSLIESVISAVKRQRSARSPGRSLVMQCLQALLLDTADDIYRLWCFAWLGI